MNFSLFLFFCSLSSYVCIKNKCKAVKIYAVIVYEIDILGIIKMKYTRGHTIYCVCVYVLLHTYCNGAVLFSRVKFSARNTIKMLDDIFGFYCQIIAALGYIGWCSCTRILCILVSC